MSQRHLDESGKKWFCFCSPMDLNAVVLVVVVIVVWCGVYRRFWSFFSCVSSYQILFLLLQLVWFTSINNPYTQQTELFVSDDKSKKVFFDKWLMIIFVMNCSVFVLVQWNFIIHGSLSFSCLVVTSYDPWKIRHNSRVLGYACVFIWFFKLMS